MRRKIYQMSIEELEDRVTLQDEEAQYAFENCQMESAILDRANELGIDIEKHRCGCHVCSMTSRLCTASLGSIGEEVERITGERKREE